MDYIKTLEGAGDTLIDNIRTAQDRTVDAVERVGKVVAPYVPDYANLGIKLPVALPRPREIAESAFRFWMRLAENQREFTLKLLDAFEANAPGAKKTA